MAIFSRRLLQKILQENNDILSLDIRNKIANALNSQHVTVSIPAQWEMILLSALRNIGEVQYEPDMVGQTRPDFLVRITHHDPIEFLADVASVSDDYYRKMNPTDEFTDYLIQKFERSGIDSKKIRYEIGSRLNDDKRYFVTAIPKRGKFDEYAGNDVRRLIDRIKQSPHQVTSITIKNTQADINIRYNPEQKYTSGDIPCHGFIDSFVEESTTYKRLESKYEQIKKSGYEGITGVFLCDAGAPIFGQEKNWHSLTIEKLVQNFLLKRSRISFVVSISLRTPFVFPGIGKPKIDFQIFTNPKPYHPCPEVLIDRLQEIQSFIPTPINDAKHARRVLDVNKGVKAFSFEGEVPIQWNRRGEKEIVKIRISARSLIETLGEKQAFEDFMIKNLLVKSQLCNHPTNPFKDAVKYADRLVNVKFISSEDCDDDWIEFEFEGTDPAVTPIKP